MEDANGGLSIQEGLVPTVRRKRKIVVDYERRTMGLSWQKGIGNNTIVLGFLDGFQYFKKNTIEGVMSALDNLD